MQNALNENQLYWLKELHRGLQIGDYGAGTLRNYIMEMHQLFQYHHTKTVEEITQSDITDYLIFIKKYMKLAEPNVVQRRRAALISLRKSLKIAKKSIGSSETMGSFW